MSRVEPLELRVGDEQVLRGWLRSSAMPAGLVQRARIVLLAAEGEGNAQVARIVGVSLPTVHSWRRRYAGGGLVALDDRPRSGRPAVHDEQVIIAATLDRPPETTWRGARCTASWSLPRSPRSVRRRRRP